MTDIPNEAVVVGARALSNQRGDACESQALREHFASLVLTAANNRIVRTRVIDTQLPLKGIPA